MPANDATGRGDGLGSSSNVLNGRPDLEKDALKELRERQRMLKSEAKRVATDLKNKKKQKKKRALRRCATLQTRDIVQVLLERGVVIPSADSDAVSGGASSSGDHAPVDAADMVELAPAEDGVAIADEVAVVEPAPDAMLDIVPEQM